VNRGLNVLLLVAAGGLVAALAAGPVSAKAPKAHVRTHVKVHVRAVPAGVRIAGVRVGGMTATAAAAAVRKAFATPLPLRIDGQTVELHPARLASAFVEPAVAHAMSARAGTNIHLVVSVHGAPLRATAAVLERRFDTKARNASLSLVNGKPRVDPDVRGRRIDRPLLLQRVAGAITGNVRLPVTVKEKVVMPAVSAQSIGPMILINREANSLTLFHANNAVWRVFSVATGQAIYPTPAGRFSIVVKWVNPTWYPPTQDAWAAGLSPVPPGPDNPLGTRWMGLSAPGIGIHGTDEPSSIGWNASHGCIRMQVADSEWLFSRVRIGTTVFIV
jgi:lipoprotein-anchoring transpeptidase ErfK/SrfK